MVPGYFSCDGKLVFGILFPELIFENRDFMLAAAPEKTPAIVRPTVARLFMPGPTLLPEYPPRDDMDVDNCSENYRK